jgi:hypothetical protein
MREESWLYRSTFEKIREICTGTNNYLIGLGRTSPWQVEALPELVNINTQNQEQMVGWIKVEEIKPVVTGSALELGGVLVGDTVWNPVALDQLEQRVCSHCLFRANLYHNDLPVSSFRSVGLYKAPTPLPTTRFTLDISNPSLIYLVHKRPTTKKSNCIESIPIVTNMRFA